MFNPSPLVSTFFKDNISVNSNAAVLLLFLFRENLNDAALLKAECLQLPSPNPAKPHLKHSVIAQTLLGYSVLNIRIALKLLMELPPQQAQKSRNTELQARWPVRHKSGLLRGKTEGVSSQPAEYYYTADSTGVTEEENRLSEPKV